MQKTHSLFALSAALCLSLFATSANAEQKIISAGSAVTELLIALGQQDKIVAVDVTSQLPQGMTRPMVGYHRQLSSEGLLATGANQVIGSDEMGPKTTLDQLKSAGIEVDIVNTKPTPEGLMERIDQLASLTHSEQKAQSVKHQVQKQLDELSKNKPQTGTEKKVLFLLIHEGRPANVAGKNTTPDEIIHLAGALNPAAKELESYRPLSNEAIIEMQPDVVLVSTRSFKQMGGADAVLKALPMLAATPAGQQKQIIPIDGHALVGGLGLKSLDEARRINQLIYP